MESVEGPLTKSQRRKQKAQARQPTNNLSLKLVTINAKTGAQKLVFKHASKVDVLTLHGCPGTGKTFLALHVALSAIADKDSIYKQVLIVRSSVSVRDAGFLPGNINEKMAAFEAPYIALCTELYGRGDAYAILKQRKQIEFRSTAHTRGLTFNNTIVIVDECQNMSAQELNTLITRFGQNCKMILCGDVGQDDLTSERFRETSGFSEVMDILDLIEYPSYKAIEFTVDDIVRSGFVREYIIAKMDHEAEKDRYAP